MLSCSDDKTIRCWDLSQEGKCVKTLDDAHGHFVSCMRWAPNMAKAPSAVNGDANTAMTNGTTKPKEEDTKVGIRCVLATGSVDLNVRVFAS